MMQQTRVMFQNSYQLKFVKFNHFNSYSKFIFPEEVWTRLKVNYANFFGSEAWD